MSVTFLVLEDKTWALTPLWFPSGHPHPLAVWPALMTHYSMHGKMHVSLCTCGFTHAYTTLGIPEL